jgi:hypothetical protein
MHRSQEDTMDIGHPIRRHIVVPRLPSRRPADSEPVDPVAEPAPTVPARERETEPA